MRNISYVSGTPDPMMPVQCREGRERGEEAGRQEKEEFRFEVQMRRLLPTATQTSMALIETQREQTW